MEEKDRTLIEKYFAHELSVQEKNAMEQRLTTDSEFAMEFEAYRQAVEALKLVQRDELKNRFRERDRVLDQVDKPSSGKRRYFFLLAAALIITVAGIWVLNNGREPVMESEIAIPQDTLKTQEISEIKNDTLLQEDRPPMASVEEKEKDKWDTNAYDGEELYAANFEPYTDESLEGTVRGDEEDMLPEERFLSSYSEGHYDVAVESFSEMGDEYRQNKNMQFLYANALLAEGLTDEAIRYLNDIVKETESDYASEANYYLGLAYLKKKNYPEAKKYLKIYAAENNTQRTKAQRILSEIK